MDDQNSVHTDPAAAQMAAPAVATEPKIENGVKVYPSSFVPIKSTLHTPKKPLIALETIHIEVIHVIIFIIITIVLFIGMWKRPNLR